MNLEKELIYREFLQREDLLLRAPYNPELEFYSYIKEGNLAKIKELCQETLLDKKGLGVLSDNFLQHIKYHFVVTTAMTARYCIEGGMEVATAYSLSDFYIQKADKCKTAKEVSDLHPVMCLDYTKRMRNLRREKICSKPIARSIDYILEHLHTHITVADLSELTGLNESYLSHLFKKETGQTIRSYIQDKKIETACNMLTYSEYSPSQIASILAFPSQSYFTEIFRKKTGLTPKKYQTLHFRDTQIGSR